MVQKGVQNFFSILLESNLLHAMQNSLHAEEFALFQDARLS